MKKLLAILLAVMLCASCAFAESAFTPAAEYDIGERNFDGGEITLEPAAQGGGTVGTEAYAGEEGKDYTDEKVYTYNAMTGAITSTMNWDINSWETNEDDQIVAWITSGFYNIMLNADKTGYAIVPEMAADYPVDVTAEYVGKFGVAEGETAKAWRIALNPDACFEDGTMINADDYIYSMQQQLNPKMLNRRADSWYDGSFSIVNAKNYLYAGSVVYNAITGEEAEDTEFFVDMWEFWGLQGAQSDDGAECPQYVSMNDETMYRDLAIEDPAADEAYVSGKYLYDNYLAVGAAYEDYRPDYLKVAETSKVVTWEDVGLVKVDDYTIDFVLEKPVAEPAFYIPYNLSGNFLVKKDLYESCKSFFNAEGAPVETEEEADTVTTTYCRTLDTSCSYGPYMLTGFELDKQYTLTRNENWFGYKDGKHLGQYQADILTTKVIVDHTTAMMAYENGELDEVGLQSDDMEKYASSDYIMYTPESYTTKVSFNNDYSKLLEHGTNSQVLIVDEFRKAFAFAIDRNEFATAYTASHKAGYGILNYMYCYDPFSGSLYRDSEAAKAALCRIFDLTYGEGGEFETLDEAYEAMTGYDMPKAQELMKTAYDKAVEAGIYDGESDITIEFRVYNSDDIYVQMINYFDQQLAEACVGSGFEGKVKLTLVVDADYYETNYSGGTDCIFTTWGGAEMAPFEMLAMCYTDGADGSANQMEYGYDSNLINLTFTVNGTPVTDTLRNWTVWANSGDVPALTEAIGDWNSFSYNTRCQFYAGMEACFLNWYTTTSIYYRNTASLRSEKINYASDTYLVNVAFGGLPYITFNYDDTEWADYMAGKTAETEADA